MPFSGVRLAGGTLSHRCSVRAEMPIARMTNWRFFQEISVLGNLNQFAEYQVGGERVRHLCCAPTLRRLVNHSFSQNSECEVGHEGLIHVFRPCAYLVED